MEVRKGYKRTEVGIIPSDWEIFKFGQLVDYTKGFAFKSKDYKTDGIRIIRVSDTTFDSIKEENQIYLDEGLSNQYRKWRIEEDDLIYSTVGSKPPMYDSMVGKVIIILKKYEGSLLNQNAVLIRAKRKSKYKQQLLLNHFRTKRYLRYIESIFRGNANQASITLEELFQFQIPLPKLDSEQTAIATVLSDTDALISSLENLIAKKRNIKQGAMQELLTVKKRLPGFSGKWEMKKLGEIVEMKKGQLITEKTCIPGNIPVIAGGKTPAYFHNRSNRLKKTITISASGASAGYVSFHSYPIFASDCSTIEEGLNYSVEFIFFKLQLVQEKIYKMQTGGAQPHIHPSDLCPIEFSIPKKEEQTAIAKTLSDMDAEIEQLEQKLDKFKMIKQGMMQELLTGETRLI